jgi:polyferredoxin
VKKNTGKDLLLPALTAVVVIILLLPLQFTGSRQMILFERIFPGGGYLQIAAIALFAATMEYNMLIPERSGWWRRFSWSLFSAIFFLQLILGIAVDKIFLMTGELHLPVPALIISGPLYRGELSVMTLIFLSAVVLSGPAWCSKYCYFGAIDSAFAGRRGYFSPKHNTLALKNSFLILAIAVALLLRLTGAGHEVALAAGIATGITGLVIMILISGRRHKMIHCSVWCPVGTLVNYLKHINPFRLKIENSCTGCMRCTAICRYNALTKDDIANLKPGITCTLCGDCLSECRHSSISYRFPGLGATNARRLYITITVVIYSLVLAMARI